MLPLLLQKHKPQLSDLNDRFSDIKGLQAKIISFVETKPTYLFNFISVGLVSANLRMTRLFINISADC